MTDPALSLEDRCQALVKGWHWRASYLLACAERAFFAGQEERAWHLGNAYTRWMAAAEELQQVLVSETPEVTTRR